MKTNFYHKKIYKVYIFIITLIPLFFGCENIIEGELPYTERLVIQSELQAGDTVDVHISRTLPPLGTYKEEDARITNANAYITCEGKNYPLRYVEKDFYTTDSLIATIGKTYELFVEWNGKKATAKTTIPPIVTIDAEQSYIKKQVKDFGGGSISYEYYGYIFVLSQPHNVFSIFIQRDNPNYYFSNYINTTYYQKENVLIEVQSGMIFVQSNPQEPQFYTFIKNYDEQYYPFYKTFRSSNGSITGNSSDAPVQWNVTGDAIGMFIGSSVSPAQEVKLKQ